MGITDKYDPYQTYEETIGSSSVKKLFLKISLISQESTCVGVSFLMKLQASGTLQHICMYCVSVYYIIM